jgi:uncharacterized protein (TIGR03067 family)
VARAHGEEVAPGVHAKEARPAEEGQRELKNGPRPLFLPNFTFKGDEAVVEGNDAVKKEYAKIRVKLDLSTMPKSMDITVVGGVQKDAVIEGIYELKEDELKICAKVFGNDRPTGFSSPEGSSIFLLVLKRQK